MPGPYVSAADVLPALTGTLAEQISYRQKLAKLVNPFVPQPGILFRDFSDTSGVSFISTGGSMAVNTDPQYVKDGSASLRITTGTGANTQIRCNVSPTVLEASGRFGVWVYVPDYTLLTNLFISVRLDPTTSRNFGYAFSEADKKFNGWHWVTATKDVFGAGDDWDNTPINRFDVGVTPVNPATPVTVYVDSARRGFKARPKLIIYADDGYASWYTIARPLLNARGLKSTVALVGGLVDSATGWLTSQQVQQLYNEGHDFAVHGVSDLTGLSLSAAGVDVDTNRAWLTSRGYSRASDFFVWPNGGYNQALIDMIKARGFKTARGVASPITWNHTFGLNDRAFTHPVIGVDAATTPATVLTRLDQAIARGDTACLMFHDIVASSATSFNYTTADLTTILDGIVARLSSIDVVTISEWYAAIDV